MQAEVFKNTVYDQRDFLSALKESLEIDYEKKLEVLRALKKGQLKVQDVDNLFHKYVKGLSWFEQAAIECPENFLKLVQARNREWITLCNSFEGLPLFPIESRAMQKLVMTARESLDASSNLGGSR